MVFNSKISMGRGNLLLWPVHGLSRDNLNRFNRPEVTPVARPLLSFAVENIILSGVPMANDNECRVTEIEMRLAFQEDTLAALDKVVCEQAARIDLLEKTQRELYRRLQALHDSDHQQEPGSEPPPPHY
jgi:SlyX protein